ncbi:MAG: PQQ-dependent sugar dehydrogenase [Anaerolineales bacterium]|nr:PQQ-dependent sugar dehydrogenase [Anaerolineales bacterium]
MKHRHKIIGLMMVVGLAMGLYGWLSAMLVQIPAAHAAQNGRIGFSGNPQTNAGQSCTTCHAAGAAVPDVSISGPAVVDASTTHVYTVTITNGPAQTAGLNVSTSNHTGDLQPLSAEVQRIVDELTHSAPKAFSGNTAVFTYSWTAPASSEVVTMYAAGLSTNDGGGGAPDLLGDGTNTDTLAITVQNGVAPTPTPNPPVPVTVISLTQVTAGLNEPTDIAHAADARLFVTEQAGVIRVIDGGGNLLPTPFLDISGAVDDSGNEMGLLGLAFHPDYASNGYFYVNYTVGSPRRTRVSRFSVNSGNPNTADAGSELILLEFQQPYANHNAGDLAFGPDGYLYIPSGDGGSGGDPDNYAQNDASLLGKILRIDVDMTAGDGPDCNIAAGNNYTIPPDNAYTDGAGGNCDEIWASGMRNPWRISFDRTTGDLWIGDVGQGNYEEIDYIPAGSLSGLDFGWRCYEGTNPFNTSGCGPSSSYVDPIHEYDHSSGDCSVTGGFIYRGSQYADLQGHYIFTDYCTAVFRAITGAPYSPTVTTLSFAPGSSIFSPSTFGEDVNGELYVTNRNEGSVYRIHGAVPLAVAMGGAQTNTAVFEIRAALWLMLTLVGATVLLLWRLRRPRPL